MRIKFRITAICLISFLGLIHSYVAAQDVSAPTEVDTALEDLVSGSATRSDTIARLSDLPRETVVSGLVEALETNRELTQNDRLKTFVYNVLRQHKAGSTDDGYQQLLAGLDDPVVRTLCVIALVEAPPERRGKTVLKLLEFLDNTDFELGTHVVRTLGRFGDASLAALPAIESIFANEDVNQRYRLASAKSMLQIGGAGRALALFESSNASGRQAALYALVRFVGETEHRYGIVSARDRKEFEQELVDFVLASLASPERNVRATALEVLPELLSTVLIVGESKETYALNPEISRALADMSANDPDEGLRSQAADMLDNFQTQLSDDSAIDRWERIQSRLNVGE